MIKLIGFTCSDGNKQKNSRNTQAVSIHCLITYINCNCFWWDLDRKMNFRVSKTDDLSASLCKNQAVGGTWYEKTIHFASLIWPFALS